jgi:glyoxylase-like metal-dependent hydrolase (beta-lactamase superfamily II)
MTAAPRFAYTRGLHELGNGCFAWLQPDGGWGWSNAGLVTDAGASLLVDTLFDLALTREMLAAMRSATPAAARIDVLVNTHANGDHCYGNALLRDAEIIASQATAEEMAEVPPALMQRLLENAEQLGPAGTFFRRVFGAFDFRGIEPVLPTRTFERELELAVGGKRVRLLEVGPAHTRGDVLVHSPQDRIVFTGDILFIDGTPIVWEGPVANWIRACERIEAMDVDLVVPGHGPISDRDGARRVREYLAFVREAARERFEAGLSARDAAHDIELGAWADWRDSERIAVNVETVYRELRGGGEPASPLELFGRMAELARA